MSKMFNKISTALGVRRRDAVIIIIGLDYAGKSTALNMLKAVEQRTTDVKPTLGFVFEKFNNKTHNFTAIDMAGAGRYRTMWEQYYTQCDGVIFCVDSSDRLRTIVAKDEMWLMLQHSDMSGRNVPILIMANKCDEIGALSAIEVSQSLSLERVRGRPWHITATCALTGSGLHAGLEWLANAMKQQGELAANGK